MLYEESNSELESYKHYVQLISRYEHLSNIQQIEIFFRIRDGEIQLKKKIFKANLRLVANIAKKYRSKGLTFMDIIHEGNMGLLKAIDKFDPERGFQFSTCAFAWITQHIVRFLSDKSYLIRLSVHLYDLKAKILKSMNLAKLQNKTLTAEDIATEFKITVKKVRQLFGFKDISLFLNHDLDDEVNFDSDYDEYDINIFDIMQAQCSMNALHEIIEQLSENERHIIQLRYFNTQPNVSLMSIADELNMDIQEVRRINTKALQKIKREYGKINNTK